MSCLLPNVPSACFLHYNYSRGNNLLIMAESMLLFTSFCEVLFASAVCGWQVAAVHVF